MSKGARTLAWVCSRSPSVNTGEEGGEKKIPPINGSIYVLQRPHQLTILVMLTSYKLLTFLSDAFQNKKHES